MARKYKDQSIAPIVAFDFDGTISQGDHYPDCGPIRPYAKEVINFLTDSGVKVVINTSRDVAIDQDVLKVHDDVTPMIEYLDSNGIRYSAVNKSFQFAPFLYNSRKVYAHMYIDDRGYGWIESYGAMIYVLHNILTELLDVPLETANLICSKISRGGSIANEAVAMSKYIKRFWI